ncbi:MAG: hypothetical protein NWF00_13115 [Candidatus Bathyarchaeota archaeon]|nr:hypothetical protein [Candidatus Bathyarchaeota archaeon]
MLQGRVFGALVANAKTLLQVREYDKAAAFHFFTWYSFDDFLFDNTVKEDGLVSWDALLPGEAVAARN